MRTYYDIKLGALKTLATAIIAAVLPGLIACSEKPRSAGDDTDPARLRLGVRNRVVSGGWNYATYPYPQTAGCPLR